MQDVTGTVESRLDRVSDCRRCIAGVEGPMVEGGISELRNNNRMGWERFIRHFTGDDEQIAIIFQSVNLLP